MDFVLRDDSRRLAEIVAAGVQIAVEKREVAAADLDAQSVSRGKVVAGLHWLKGDFIYLVILHPDRRLVVAVPIAHALDAVVEAVSGAVSRHVDDFDAVKSVSFALLETSG